MANQAENIPREGALVAVFDTHTDAEGALEALRAGGFPLDRLSLVGKDSRTESHLVGFYDSGESVKVWGRRGAFWGAVAEQLDGSAFLVAPNLGHLLVFGPLAYWIMSALEGGAVIGGVSALGAGLSTLGVPRGALDRYEGSVRAGCFVLVVSGTLDDVDRAGSILRAARVAAVQDFQRAPAFA